MSDPKTWSGSPEHDPPGPKAARDRRQAAEAIGGAVGAVVGAILGGPMGGLHWRFAAGWSPRAPRSGPTGMFADPGPDQQSSQLHDTKSIVMKCFTPGCYARCEGKSLWRLLRCGRSSRSRRG